MPRELVVWGVTGGCAPCSRFLRQRAEDKSLAPRTRIERETCPLGRFCLLTMILCAFGVLSPVRSWALDFKYVYSTDLNGSHIERLVISGTIQRGDYSRFLSFIRRDPKAFFIGVSYIYLSSPGGDLAEALKIGEVLKGTFADIITDKPCISACFFMFLSGATHVAGLNVLGVHRPYFDPVYFSELTPPQAEAQHNRLLAQSRKFLEANSVPQYLIEAMFTKSSNEVYWLNLEDIDRLGERPAWYEELIIARCNWDKRRDKANRYLLDRPETDPDRRRYVAELRQLGACSGEIVFDERRRFITRLSTGAK